MVWIVVSFFAGVFVGALAVCMCVVAKGDERE